MRLGLLVALPLMAQTMSNAANYSATKLTVDGFEVVKLTDAAHRTEVTIVPSIGNNAYSMTVNGKPVLWSPYQNLAQFKQKPALLGVPLLAPWANRLDQAAFYANGKKYVLNPELGNLRLDQNHLPIHGLVTFTDRWTVQAVQANSDSAQVTSRLEFWKYPDWMAQFPFAHTIEITHKLANGSLEVRASIANLSDQPMPVSLGFHPYYQITDAPRDQWRVHLAARSHYSLSDKLIPTGETKPINLPDPLVLAGHQLDDVYGDLTGDEFSVQGKTQKIAIRYGPKYRVAVVYAPPGKEFICFEPMSGVTNAFNLAHAGIYKDLQSIAPGGKWEESFWIRPSGY
ncbi:MAG: aldose 1-epimerase [Acidobacteriota bacterium]|nr:aldose 1-epimerase [Acidobacteriota bacterium]